MTCMDMNNIHCEQQNIPKLILNDSKNIVYTSTKSSMYSNN